MKMLTMLTVLMCDAVIDIIVMYTYIVGINTIIVYQKCCFIVMMMMINNAIIIMLNNLILCSFEIEFSSLYFTTLPIITICIVQL